MSNDLTADLFDDISQLIELARKYAAQYINSSLVLLHWKIGQRIYSGILQGERAEYGRGFDVRALFR